MSKQLFPPEILEYCAENYFSKISARRQTIYALLLGFIILVFALFPVIYVDVSSQSRGIVRTPIENTLIQSAVSGEVLIYRMSENQAVKAGDTLLVFNTERINEQIALEQQKQLPHFE